MNLDKHLIVPRRNELRACGRNNLYLDEQIDHIRFFSLYSLDDAGPGIRVVLITTRPRRAMQVKVTPS